mgnify:CR=1 FL=1
MPLIPNEINQLNVVSFQTNFHRLPNTNYFCQRIDIPAINLGVAVNPTPFSDVSIAGDKLAFEQFAMNFIVNEDLSNYFEIYNWLIALGFPDNHEQFVLKHSNFNTSIKDKTTSDMNVVINTNKSNPNYIINFKEVFPVSLGSLSLDAAATSMEPLVVDATFEFLGSFSIDKIT